MDEKDPLGEEQNDSFNEDFDFGEGELDTTASAQDNPTSSSSGFQKKQLVGLAVFVVTIGIVWTGYKFYKGASTKTATTTTTPANLTAKAPTKPITIPQPPAQPSMGTPPPPPPPGTTGESFGDISQAFSSADQGATLGQTGAGQVTMPITTLKTPSQAGGSIQEMQKDLFTPEKGGSASATPQPNEVAQLTQNLNKLNQQIDFILDKIKYLDGYTQEVSENLAKFNDAITAMDRRLSSLTSTTTTLSKDVGTVRNEVGQVRRVLKEDGLDINLGAVTGKRQRVDEATVSIEEPDYMVHAVIPGRAWLKSRKGHIVTVTEGDTIGNYGKILVIDAANGVVLTSSGVTFN